MSQEQQTVEEVREMIREAAEQMVRGGFTPFEEMERGLSEYLDESAPDELLAELIPKVLAEVRHAVSEEMKGWPAITDCDRLDAAFASLERNGIVARQNFSCCMSCGSREIHDELAMKKDARGYTFFHMQDTDRAASGGELSLAFGAPTEAGMKAVARDVVNALKAAGLAPEWNGDIDHRIILPLKWQRRSASTSVVASA
jgi:hypothetical protein